ncbi:MAG: hypothetical protein CMH83_15815 [Nocardioides sp.]|nr:hypothetical protein [Nocardioides sp.]
MDAVLEQLGPDFYDDDALAEALTGADGASPDVPALRAEHRVLGLRSADERWIHPTWQVRDGAVLPGLAEVLAAFAGQPAFSVATWVTTEHDDLDGATPAGWLIAGRDVGAVVRLAGETAARWA